MLPALREHVHWLLKVVVMSSMWDRHFIFAQQWRLIKNGGPTWVISCPLFLYGIVSSIKLTGIFSEENQVFPASRSLHPHTPPTYHSSIQLISPFRVPVTHHSSPVNPCTHHSTNCSINWFHHPSLPIAPMTPTLFMPVIQILTSTFSHPSLRFRHGHTWSR